LRDSVEPELYREAPRLTPSNPSPHQAATLAKKTASEAVGTALLLATVVGSGIMAERLAGGNMALALLANTIATGAALVALILTFGPISGAHFNPAVTLADAIEGGIAWRETPAYITAQLGGAIAGTVAAHMMFQLPLVSLSGHVRSGPSQIFSEFVATFGLLCVVWGCSRLRSSAVAFAVGSYISAAYWFTASTSFANPAVTIARSLTDTFSGIRPADVPGFLAGQLSGAVAATLLFRWLVPGLRAQAKEVVLPHNSERGYSWDGYGPFRLCTQRRPFPNVGSVVQQILQLQ
jgi:glycerol uptake facilitator-like aquaporin